MSISEKLEGQFKEVDVTSEDDAIIVKRDVEFTPHSEAEELTIESILPSGEVICVVPFKDIAKVTLEDIAHALSNICRYAGRTNKFYSVAEHCVHLARYATMNAPGQRIRLPLAQSCLMHDAAEAYLGDVIYDLKELSQEIKYLDAYVSENIFEKYHLEVHYKILEPLITEYDRSISINEMKQLFDKPADSIIAKLEKKGYKELPDVKMEFWTPEVAKANFLEMAKQLGLYDSKDSSI